MAADPIPAPQPPLADTFIEPHRENVLIYYQGDLFDWHGYVKFLSLAALRETSKDVPLEKLFVEPHVAPQYLPPDALETSPLPPTQPLSLALKEHPRLVLLGDPGSGKSTVVNWICTALGRGAQSPLARQLDHGLVPLPMILREMGFDPNFAALSTASAKWERLLELFLDRPVAAQLRTERQKHTRLADSLLARMLESGQAMLLLDGIDEMGKAEIRQALRDAVHEGMRRYPRCRWVMTSRIVGYEEVRFEDLPASGEMQAPSSPGTARQLVRSVADVAVDLARGETPAAAIAKAGLRFAVDFLASKRGKASPLPGRLYLAPFNDTQVEQFTRLWWAQHESNPHLAGTKPQQFLAALRQGHGARSLSRLPHLLTMIALIYRVRAELPDGRALLYHFIADAYLGTIDKERGLESLRPIPHSVEEMRGWLAVVGWHLQRRRGQRQEQREDVLIDRDELVALLAHVIHPKPGQQPGDQALTAAETARLFLEYAGRRSGLLLPRGQDAQGRDLYAFLHLSFQEYFAAQFLRDRVCDPDWLDLDTENTRDATRREDLRRYAAQTSWRETFVFLWESAALANPVFPERVLVRLLGWPRNVTEWGEFAAPAEKPLPAQAGKSAKGRAKPGGATDADADADLVAAQNTVALVAGLSVNPHVTLRSEARSALWKRCWQWELARQENAFAHDRFAILHETAVARQLLSRPGFAADACAMLVQVADQQQTARLFLTGCTALSNLAPLASLTHLRWLTLSGCTALSDFSALANLTNLRGLYLSGCTALSEVSPLAKLVNLELLYLGGCTALTNVSALASLTKLEWLYFSGCTALGDVSPVAGFSNLQFLDLSGCTALNDVPSLTSLHHLKLLDLRDCPALPQEQIAQLRQARPDLKVLV